MCNFSDTGMYQCNPALCYKDLPEIGKNNCIARKVNMAIFSFGE